MSEQSLIVTVGRTPLSRCWVVALLGGALLVSLAAVAYAQEAYSVPRPSIIVTEGKATIDVMPDYVDFWLHKRVEADSTLEATQEALRFESQLRKELDKREMKNADVTPVGPTAPFVGSPEARVSARLRFRTAPFTDPNDGPGEFGKLCDQIREIAKMLGVGEQTLLGKRYGQALEGPLFGAEDKLNAETAAIALAVENAYPHAEAAARTMQTQIMAVETIRIDEIVWGQEPETPLQEPSYHQVSCTAKVTVTYAFASRQ